LLETILGTLKVSIDSASEESQKILRYVQTSHSALQNSQSALQNSQSAFGNVKQELRETRETMKQELREIKETMAALKIQLEEFKSPQRPHRANQAPSRANPGYAHKLRHLEELQHLEALDPPYHERSDPDFRYVLIPPKCTRAADLWPPAAETFGRDYCESWRMSHESHDLQKQAQTC
jgi:hypothetical protein